MDISNIMYVGLVLAAMEAGWWSTEKDVQDRITAIGRTFIMGAVISIIMQLIMIVVGIC